MAKVFTNYQDLEKFHKELLRYIDELQRQLKSLQNETDYITSAAWKGEQAEKFKYVLDENIDSINKNIVRLTTLANNVDKAAKDLKIALSRKIGGK